MPRKVTATRNKPLRSGRKPIAAHKQTASDRRLAQTCLSQWRSRFEERYLPRIVGCLEQLSDDEIWWRPNEASNSIGNLVLHICGNMRQWIISGLGGALDLRERDKEFAERGPIPGPALREKFQQTVREASSVMARLNPEVLTRPHRIQGYDVSGYEAAAHVIEHVAYHTGQIIYVTKLKRARDLGFTKLPTVASKPAERTLPV
jgi:uncharacterized damage-inducible protein DinB